jgi:hypothetical protein
LDSFFFPDPVNIFQNDFLADFASDAFSFDAGPESTSSSSWSQFCE